MPRRPLYLHEDVLLLALRDREGTHHFGVWAHSAIGGAVLGELFLGDHIRTVHDCEQDLVEAVGDQRLDDAVLDDCLAEIRNSPTLRPSPFWAGLFGTRAGLIPETAKGLCRLGVLRTDERKVLLLFTRKTYPEVDPQPEAELIERLQAAILDDDSVVDPRTTVLIAVADQTGLLKANFDQRMLAERSSRIEGIVKGDFAGQATRNAVQAARAFFFMSAVVPRMTARP